MLKVGQVKEIYEMKGAGRSIRGIAGELGIARNTVRRYLKVAGGHAAQALAFQGIEPFDKLRRTLTRNTLTGGCPRGWETAWCCTGSSRPWAMTAAIPS